MNDPALPVINFNGDDPATLVHRYRDACNALEVAINVVALSAPHGRNYQDGDSSYNAARAEHDERLQQLLDMKRRLQVLAIHCHRSIVTRA